MATTTYGTPYVSGTDLVANWPAASLTVANSIDAAGYYVGRGINAQTASYTGVLTDAGKTVTMTVATANTFTVPANASVAYPTGTRINILNLGAGACTPTAGAGVTISGTITALTTNGSASIIKTATNTWSYIPAGGGKILQVVNATVGTAASSSSSAYADTGLTATITPTSNTSKILVLVDHADCQKSVGNTELGIKLLRGATSIHQLAGQAAYNASTGLNSIGSVSCAYLDSPATTSATTYKTQFASMTNAAAVIVQSGSIGVSTITLMEVAA